jgi:putative ATPase
MKQWGYGSGYQHAHNFADALTAMECLPEPLKGTEFYKPTDRGFEKRLRERLHEIEEVRKTDNSS